MLNASGHYGGPVDGKPGAPTLYAVAQANCDLLQMPGSDQGTVTDALMQALGARARRSLQ
ncbi:MAG: hypothetical protein MK160_01865 [Rhodobacteraceae bacterium]|nr:hypothetical protein [Paracoccaceae bacterium]